MTLYDIIKTTIWVYDICFLMAFARSVVIENLVWWVFIGFWQSVAPTCWYLLWEMIWYGIQIISYVHTNNKLRLWYTSKNYYKNMIK